MVARARSSIQPIRTHHAASARGPEAHPLHGSRSGHDAAALALGTAACPEQARVVDGKVFFESWTAVARTLIVGVCAYAALVVLLRMSGNRTLSKLNAFDLIVTVALGSTFASILTSKDVALTQGICAFALLIGLQFVVTWMSVRSRTVDRLVKSEPVLLVHRGEYIDSALRKSRVTRDEVRAVVRSHGTDDVASVRAVVLESDGTMSVVVVEGGHEPALRPDADVIPNVADED